MTVNQTKLVLVGGGHSHVIVLKQIQQFPLVNTQIILISNVVKTPYSGMLPAHIAGFYPAEEIYIDLRALTQVTQVKFYLDQCVRIDLENKQIFCQNTGLISFDYLSIDIGSTPDQSLINGAKEFAISAKPVPQFLEKWYNLLTEVKLNSQNINVNKPLQLGIVGGGAGGVELALNMNHRLSQLLPENHFQINLIHRQNQLLSNHNQWVSKRLYQLLLKQKINLYLNENVTKIEQNLIICQSGLKINCNFIFLVTQASASSWVKNSQLTTDQNGFILINSYLQSVSHPFIFASGDIASFKDHPRPKAGVFAVRQGKPLFENLARIINNQPLKSYIPQKYYLSLIGTGNQKAIASWGQFGCESSIFWYIKDYIDRQFMQQFKV